MISIDPIRPYLNAIKAGAIVLALLLVWFHGYGTGRDKWQGKYDTEAAEHVATKASHKAVVDNLAALTKAAADKAKAASVAAKADRKTNDARFKDAQHEADKAKRELRDHLRRGTGPVRLRDEWTCPAARPAEGATAAASGGQDAAADLRAAGAADLVAAGDAADNWITWLQSELTSTRKACGVEDVR